MKKAFAGTAAALAVAAVMGFSPFAPARATTVDLTATFDPVPQADCPIGDASHFLCYPAAGGVGSFGQALPGVSSAVYELMLSNEVAVRLQFTPAASSASDSLSAAISLDGLGLGGGGSPGGVRIAAGEVLRLEVLAPRLDGYLPGQIELTSFELLGQPGGIKNFVVQSFATDGTMIGHVGGGDQGGGFLHGAPTDLGPLNSGSNQYSTAGLIGNVFHFTGTAPQGYALASVTLRFTAEVVPLPGAMGLLAPVLAGLCGLGAVRRRRRNGRA